MAIAVVIVIAIMTAVDVADGDVIAAAESIPVVATEGALYMRVTELVTVVDVGAAVIIEVLAGTFDAIMKALTLDLLEFGRRCIPSASGAVLVCAGWRGRWALLVLGLCCAGA